MNLHFILGAALGVILFAGHARADPLADLTKRVNDLESRQEDYLLEAGDQRTSVNSFLPDSLTLGGFFEPAFTYISGPDTATQAANSSNTLGINLSSEFRPDLRFVSQFLTGLVFPLQNPNGDPKGASLGLPSRREFKGLALGAILAQGYLEYSFNRYFNLQGGTGYVPFGYALQQREPVLFLRRGGPRLSSDANLVSPLWSGLHAYGSMAHMGSHVGYDAYTFTPILEPKTPGYGARVWWSNPGEKMTVGFSSQTGKRAGATHESLGTDVRLQYSAYSLTTEYARQLGRGRDTWSAYVEPAIFVLREEVLLYLHADYLDDPSNLTSAGASEINDPIRKWEYGGGVNWLPTSYTRLRLGISYNDYVGENAIVAGQNRDYLAIDTSIGVAF